MLDNKDEVLEMLEHDEDILFCFKDLSEELQNDREVILALLQRDGLELEYLPEDYKKDKEFVWQACSSDFGALRFADKKFSEDKEFLLELTSDWLCEGIYDIAPESIKKDEDFVYKTIEMVDKYLLSSEDRATEVAIHIVKDNPDMVYVAWNYFVPNLNREFMLLALSIDGSLLDSVGDKEKDDKEIVLTAVKQNGMAIQFASDRLKGDKDIALAAIATAGTSVIYYVSKELKDDKELILAAINRKKYNMFAGGILSIVSDRLKDDKEVVLAAIEHSTGLPLCDASERLKDDYDVVLAAIKKNYVNTFQFDDLLKYASQRIRSNKEYVLELLSINGFNIKYVSDELKRELDVIDVAIKDINKSKKEVLGGSFETSIDNIRDNGMALIFAPTELMNNKELVKETLKDTLGLSYYCCSKEMQDDPEIKKIVLDMNPAIIEYVEKLTN